MVFFFLVWSVFFAFLNSKYGRYFNRKVSRYVILGLWKRQLQNFVEINDYHPIHVDNKKNLPVFPRQRPRCSLVGGGTQQTNLCPHDNLRSKKRFFWLMGGGTSSVAQGRSCLNPLLGERRLQNHSNIPIDFSCLYSFLTFFWLCGLEVLLNICHSNQTLYR